MAKKKLENLKTIIMDMEKPKKNKGVVIMAKKKGGKGGKKGC